MLSHIMSQILSFEAVDKYTIQILFFLPFVLASNAIVYNNLTSQNCILSTLSLDIS